MARQRLTFSLLILFLAIFISQRTLLAESYWPWFLASHPDSPRTSGLRPGVVSNEPAINQEPLQAPKSPVTLHHALGIQGDLSEDAFVRRIVAVGDIHGDFGNALKVLRMSGVIDEEGRWTGLVDFFVQTGDIIDRWGIFPWGRTS